MAAETTALVVARPTPCGTALGIEAVIAAHHRDDEAEDRGLDQAGGHVVQFEEVGGVAEIGIGVEAQRARAHDVAAHDADGVADGNENGQRHHRRDDAGADEILEGIGGQRHQRIDLLGDPHGAKLGGDRGADAARHHESGKHGAKFAGDAQRHDGGHQALGIEARGAEIDLQRQRAAGEEGGEPHHGKREVADLQHLIEDLADVDLRRQALQQPVLEEERDAAHLLHQGEDGTADVGKDVQARWSDSRPV